MKLLHQNKNLKNFYRSLTGMRQSFLRNLAMERRKRACMDLFR